MSWSCAARPYSIAACARHADAVGRHGDLARERVDAHLHRLHEFVVKDFAEVDRFEQFGGHVLSYEW
jgi:hypothetical protein